MNMKILSLYKNEYALEQFDWLNKHGRHAVLWSNKLYVNWCLTEIRGDLNLSSNLRKCA